MYLTKWDPFETLTSLQEDIDNIFNRHLRLRGDKRGFQADWVPAVDIYEDKEAFYFDVEAPGLAKDNFDVNIENSTLTIKGQRAKKHEEKDKNYYRIEREYGAFTRSFTLPDTADSAKVNAEYKNGILTVKIAKKEAAKPRRIAVTVG